MVQFHTKFKIKKKRTHQQLLTQVRMLINEQMKHPEISQKLLRWKFINIKTLSMKTNYISFFTDYIIYFQNHEGARFLKVNIILDSY